MNYEIGEKIIKPSPLFNFDSTFQNREIGPTLFLVLIVTTLCLYLRSCWRHFNQLRTLLMYVFLSSSMPPGSANLFRKPLLL